MKTARKALAEVYGTVPSYITHSPISPQVQTIPDLYYREGIRDSILHNDNEGEEDMQERYKEYLMCHGRELEGYPWRTPEVDRWRRELEEMADWLNNEQWP